MAEIDYTDAGPGVSPEIRAQREKFTGGSKITYRGLTGVVVPSNLISFYKAPWFSVPVNLDGDRGYIHYLNFNLLELVSEPEPEVIEATETYQESGIYRDKTTGKIWANTSMDHERFYCLNDSFTWPLFGPMDHWTPLYEKVWNAA